MGSCRRRCCRDVLGRWTDRLSIQLQRVKTMAKQQMTFEKAMARLDEIVQSIEQGKVGLEASIKQFEEGMSLIRRCRGVLSEAELKIRQLQAAGQDGAEASDKPVSAGG